MSHILSVFQNLLCKYLYQLMLYLVLVLTFCNHQLVQNRLIYAFAMIRHGVLYPKNDYFAKNITVQFKTELTPTGMRQLYNLGTYFKADYITKQKYISQHFNRSQVEFFSSSLQRTQLSTYCLMYGLYPLQEGQRIPSKTPMNSLQIPFTPLVPNRLSTEPSSQSFALKQGFQPLPLHPLDQILDRCFNFDNLSQTRMQQIAKEMYEFGNQTILFIEKMSLLFKIKPKKKTISGMAVLYRSIQSDRYVGLVPGEEYTQEDDKQLKYMYQYYNALFNTGKFGRILVTLPFQFLREKLRQAANKESLKKMTYIVYHSSNMWPLMINLNITSAECIKTKHKSSLPPNVNCKIPHYGSSMIIQLHEDEKILDKYIKLKYNGLFLKICGKDEEKCPLDEFIERLRNTEEDYDKECGQRPGKGFVSPKK